MEDDAEAKAYHRKVTPSSDCDATDQAAQAVTRPGSMPWGPVCGSKPWDLQCMGVGGVRTTSLLAEVRVRVSSIRSSKVLLTGDCCIAATQVERLARAKKAEGGVTDEDRQRMTARLQELKARVFGKKDSATVYPPMPPHTAPAKAMGSSGRGGPAAA